MKENILAKRVTANEVWLMLPFFITAMDSLVDYFFSNHLISFRVGLLSALALAIVLVKFRYKVIKVRAFWVLSLLFLLLSLGIGVISADNVTASKRIPEIIGIIIYFLCGYVCFRWVKNKNAIQGLFLLVGFLYVVICVTALLRVAPEWFPVIDAVWSQEGVLQLRPEVMTDQNFQVFYFIPLAIAYVMPSSLLRFLAVTLLLVGAAYTLAQLQTRSGVIVLLSVILIGLLASLRNPSMGRRGIVATPIILMVVFLLALPFVIKHADLLIYRFFGMDYRTGLGRLISATYLFEKIANPDWWIPKGGGEFMSRYGVYPHSNFTALFLESGLIGLIAALGIIAYPVIRLSSLIAKGNKDAVVVAVGCAGIGVLVLQLSLYVVAHAQVWLWAGSVVGVLDRLYAENKRRSISTKPYQERTV